MKGEPTPLNPAQRAMLDALGPETGTARVGDDHVAELRAELEDRLAPLAPGGDETLTVHKSGLAAVNGCEGRWLAERDEPFRWNAAMARGTVAHRAIGLGLHWRGPRSPARLVDEALGRIEEGSDSLGEWLRTVEPAERAELREGAVNHVTAFEEVFPPLKPEWTPCTDGSLAAELAGGGIVLRARPDLALGRAQHRGKVIVDFKTGRGHPHHLEDLRFYALVDALRLGVAPVRTATVYLETGRVVPETVTPGTLEAATERVVRSVETMVEILAGERAPALRPSPICRWCPAADRCEPGTAFLAGDPDDDLALAGLG